MLDIIDESGMALGSLKSATTFFSTALKQVSLSFFLFAQTDGNILGVTL
jgi:hypothetical protein